MHRRTLMSSLAIIALIPLGCASYVWWYVFLTPTLPLPPHTRNFQGGSRFPGPDHMDEWSSFDVPASSSEIIAFYQQQGAEYFRLSCSGKTFLGRADYQIEIQETVDPSFTRVNRYMVWLAL